MEESDHVLGWSCVKILRDLGWMFCVEVSLEDLTALPGRLRRNFDVCAIFRKFLAVFLRFRRCSDAFGSVRIHSDAFGYIRMRSDAFGNSRKISEVFGNNLYVFDDSERFRRFLEAFGRVRMHSDAFGSFWKLPEIFRFFELFLENFGIFRTCAHQKNHKVWGSQCSPRGH